MIDLKNKNIFVTGATGGIGGSIIETLKPKFLIDCAKRSDHVGGSMAVYFDFND